jgi:serine/threonine protein phosphatase PrpC
VNTHTAWNVGAASDRGRQRSINEDRVFVDESLGLFLVVDGMGGHAAGETAAQTALDVIRNRASAFEEAADLEHEMREVVTAANNAVFQLGEERTEYTGMACVLTLAAARDGRVTVAHVGDSRLYLAWNGELRKMTPDHSPVGEQEDSGELTERDAMNHPRRNEVYRDVGSELHNPDDPGFIDTKTFLFRPDAALLLCSDGLSDVLTSTEISSIVEHYDGDAAAIANELINAANAAGGKDNISVVFVPGPDFVGRDGLAIAAARQRHAVTRVRPPAERWQSVLRTAIILLLGMAIGIALWIGVQRFWH